ncbi:MAG: hypothetical protein QF752_12415 [Planctomycetota bacterium]|jgi:hypothetical protein|nr:hypothetical protein [Planctomycetota bacterium]
MSNIRFLMRIAFLFTLIALPLVACPNCKDALVQEGPDGEAWSRQADAFYWGILFMLGTLFMGGFSLIRLLVRAGADVATLPQESPSSESQEVRDKASNL